jgi:hypothetical protein
VTSISLPLIPSQSTYSYPKEADKARKVAYFPLEIILTRAWTSDVHMAGYTVPDLPYRLSRDAVQLGDGVLMVVFIADVDCEQSHAASGGHGDAPAPDDWWLGELVKLDALRREFSGAFVYRTRGGYRVVYVLRSPTILRTMADAEDWTAEYLAWVAALRRRFQIFADPACADWQRLFRTPHATRAFGRPEARETIGSPYQIGAWTCEPTEDEREVAKTLARKPSTRRPRESRDWTSTIAHDGHGILFYAFKARGWLGDTLDEEKWSVQCPWEDQHTKGTTFNTSTVLFAPGAGDLFGWLHCSHGHCQHRDIRDVLRVFSEDELSRAKREAGVITPTVQAKHHVQMYKPHFGLRVKGVGHAS